MAVTLILGLALLLFFAPTISNVIASKTKETPEEEQARKSKEKAEQARREDEGVFATAGRIILGDKYFEETFVKSKNSIPELEESASNTLGRPVQFSENTTLSKDGVIESDKSPTFQLSENDIILINQAREKQAGRKATNFGVVN